MMIANTALDDSTEAWYARKSRRAANARGHFQLSLSRQNIDPNQTGQRREIKSRRHGIAQRAGGTAQQRAAADPGHHAARQQREIFGPLGRCHQARHDDRPQGVEHAPAQPQQQTEKQQQMAEPRRQGKAQAGRHQQYAE